MTRKKFVKKMMSLGMQRNEANEVAFRCNAKGRAYKEALLEESVKYNFRKIGRAFVEFAQSTETVAKSFVKLREVYGNASKTN